MCVAGHAQITQNKKFPISLQYLKKQVNGEVDLLHAGKHKHLLQIDTTILLGEGQAFPKIASFQCFYNISKMKLEIELIICMKINIKVACKLISTL